MDESGTADQVDWAAVSPGVSTAVVTPTREVDPLTVTQRLQREDRWYGQIELERDEMMKLSKGKFPDKRARQQWVYGELHRMYPPLNLGKTLPGNVRSEPDNVLSDKDVRNASGKADDGQIQGLSAIPDAWPELPANASLSAEAAWVQANRLRIVEERASGATLVHLAQALSPAPSWAALGWLETSIRSYAKYVDVAAKATASDDGDAEVWKRERMAIEEMEGLLEQMMGDED